MKKTHAVILILAGIAAAAAVTQFTVSYAGPAATPPGGNVIPRFNGLEIAASDNTTILTISTEKALISNPTSNPVIFNDAQGIMVAGMALSGGGGITGINQDVKLIDSGSGTTRIDAQTPIVNTTSSLGGAVNNPVLIADSGGFAIADDAKEVELKIGGISGEINAPQPGRPVTIADNDGLWVNNDSVTAVGGGLRIYGTDARIERMGGFPVQINDNEGFQVADQLYRVRLNVNPSTGAISNPYLSEPLYFNDTIYITGNVGIGTSTPNTSLNIYNGNESATLTDFTQAVTKAGLLLSTDYTAGSYTPGLFWQTVNNNNTMPKAGIWLYEDSSGTDMNFGTSNSYATGVTNTAMVIDQAGNVGIGTTDPIWKLEVNGDASFTLPGVGRVNIGEPAGQKGIAIMNADIDSNRADLRFDGSTVKLVAGLGTSYPSEGNGIAINTAGNVGIGTTSPGYKLTVEGTAWADNMYVNSGAGEYVYLYGGTGNVSASGSVTAGANVTAYNGYMRASSIGRFYNNNGTVSDPNTAADSCHYDANWGATPNKFCVLWAYCDEGTDKAISVSAVNTSAFSGMDWSYVASKAYSDRGFIVFRSSVVANGPDAAGASLLCFSPNG